MKNLKKVLALFTAVIVLFSVVACNRREEESNTSAPIGNVSTTQRNEYNLGFGLVQEISDQKAAYTATFAAVVTDATGKIIKCVVDQLEAEADTDNITQSIGKEFPTKTMLGDRYAMKGASGIGKEWYEQANAFAEHCVGKTAAEVESSLDAEGKIPDLSASCTVKATDFVSAVKTAVKNTGSSFNTEKPDEMKLGLSVKAVLSSSSNESTADDSGKAVFSCTFSAAAVDGSSKVYYTYIDEAECEIPFDTEGMVILDQVEKPYSKKEKGKDYGMKAASKINKEWFEQANAFESYCVGKTAEQVLSAPNQEGKVPDLAASCTVYSANFAAAVADAMKNAR